jgi:hypothetical protein
MPREIHVLFRPPHRRVAYIPSPPLAPDVYQRSDGLYQIGLDDETSAGPFESVLFAMAVAADQVRREVRQ